MKNRKKKMVIGLIGAAVFVTLAMAWLYPYSAFGIDESYSFTPDPVVVDGYAKDLSQFKDSFENDFTAMDTATNIDLTVDRTQYVLPLFEQEWLMSKKSVDLNLEDWSNVLFQVKNARNTLLDLSAQEDYPKEQRRYLVDSIESLLALEEEVTQLITGDAKSRQALDTQISNLHMSFQRNFMVFEVFYERSQTSTSTN